MNNNHYSDCGNYFAPNHFYGYCPVDDNHSMVAKESQLRSVSHSHQIPVFGSNSNQSPHLKYKTPKLEYVENFEPIYLKIDRTVDTPPPNYWPPIGHSSPGSFANGNPLSHPWNNYQGELFYLHDQLFKTSLILQRLCLPQRLL